MTAFRKLLKEKDITASQVARRIGRNPATVNCWAVGRNTPSYNDLVKMTVVLNVSIERLVLCFVDEDDFAIAQN